MSLAKLGTGVHRNPRGLCGVTFRLRRTWQRRERGAIIRRQTWPSQVPNPFLGRIYRVLLQARKLTQHGQTYAEFMLEA